ncbi:surface-adhesin E family protein [uncultured Ramlibacter sp.]|uniref:surface-adhesin E family protein n=1 Tax=uncultured Ramlibacter sp. TaxID=260755 RepID=UPI00261E727F|nr:surface-adhesin E family protein [uncultured Ramlibacter sp.]
MGSGAARGSCALAGLLALAVPWAQAQGIWLTVAGDPADKAVDTVQVDPIPLEVQDNARTMRVRVSRANPRTSWDGVPYRSYVADVLFDCGANTARYLSISYYALPHWPGQPSRTISYSGGEPRWMEFRQIEPNPTQRILNAACNRPGR